MNTIPNSHYTPKQGHLPVYLSEYLEISDPVITYDKLMEEIIIEKYLRKVPKQKTGRLRYNPVDMLKTGLFGFADEGYIAGRKGMSVIHVEKVMVSDGAGFSSLLLDILRQRSIPFEQCLTGIDTVTLVIRSQLLSACKDELIEEIRSEMQPDNITIKENLCMIAVTGEKDTRSSDANMKVLRSLSEENIEISTINQGAGKLNLLIGVPKEFYEKAIRNIYRTLENN